MVSSAGEMRRLRLWRTAYLIGAATLFASVAWGQSDPPVKRRQITVADGLVMTRLAGRDYAAGRSMVAHFSRQGSRFVVVIKKGNIDRDTTDFSLLVYQTAGIFPSPALDAVLKMSSSSDRDAISKVRWLADDETLMFLGENPGETSQVYTFNIRTRLLHKVTNHSTSILNYDTTGDGREIAFIADAPESNPTHPKGSSSAEIVIAGQSLTDILAGDLLPWKGPEVFLWREKAYSPSLVSVGSEYSVTPSTLSLSPDGRYLLFPAQVRFVQSHPAWANYKNPNLQHIFASNFPNDYISPVQQYLVVDTNNMSAVPLIDAPMMGVDPVFWAEDSKSVYLSSYLPLNISRCDDLRARGKGKYLVEVAVPSRQFKQITKQYLLPNVDNPPPPLNVTVEQDLNTPPKLYVSDPENRKKELLLDLNPQFDELQFGAVKRVEWQVHGVGLIGGLYLPPDYVPGKQYPAVIQTHGFSPDDFSMDGLLEWSSGYAARPLAARGIIVLQVFEFQRRGDLERIILDRTLGATAQEAVRNFHKLAYEGAIDYLRRQAMIDQRRVGIVGFSRTVCFVGYTLTHSTYQFAAASLVDGISCGYFEAIAHPDEADDVNYLNGGHGPFGEGLKLWMKNSPGFNLDRIQTPVRLVALGTNSVLAAWEWYAGLILQKKPVDFVLIPGAVHIGVKVSQRMLTQQGIVDWFAFWLQGAEDDNPSKRDQYSRWCGLRNESLAKSYVRP